MSVNLQKRHIYDLRLLYKNDRKTKWLAEVLVPHYEEAVKIYLTRPANESKEQLRVLIQNCKSLSELLKENGLMV